MNHHRRREAKAARRRRRLGREDYHEWVARKARWQALVREGEERMMKMVGATRIIMPAHASRATRTVAA